MNRFKTTDNGGLPFVLDDLRFDQDAIRETITGIASAWGITADESFILSGCEATLNGAVYDIAAGYIWLEGEVLKVDAHSVDSNVALTRFWQVVTTYDSSGDKTFQSGGTFQTYEVRKAEVSASLTPPSPFMPMAADTIHAKIKQKAEALFGEWTFIDLEGSTDVVSNEFIDGTGVDRPLSQAPLVGSFLAYNIVGKVVNLVGYVADVKPVPATTDPASSIIIRNLPFDFATGYEQRASVECQCPSHADAISGTGRLIADKDTNNLIFNLLTPQGTQGGFNRFYELEAAPSKNLQLQTADTTLFRWRLNINATFILK